MSMVIPPHKMRGSWPEMKPFIDINFLSIVSEPNDFAPRTFTSSTVGARPAAGIMFSIVGIFYDRPEYNNFATLLQKFDIFVDSGTRATGTLGIDNTAGAGGYTVDVGDYFIFDTEPDDNTRRIYIATSSTTVGAGLTGSVSIEAERPGTRYNASGVGARGIGAAYNRYDDTNLETITRYINLTPNSPGAGGATTFTITASGGAGVENDPTYLWPNGSALSANQKLLVVSEGLLSSTVLPLNWSSTGTDPYTKAFATTYVNILNKDSSAHTITVSLQGNVFSGSPVNTQFR